MKNEVYPKLREYVKEHHGFSSDKLHKTELWKEYQAFQDYLKSLEGKKIKLSYTSSIDCWGKVSGEKIGKIKVDKDGLIRFFEGRRTVRYYNLDAGLFEGWYATLIPVEIVEV